jgi:hypothetical protein
VSVSHVIYGLRLTSNLALPGLTCAEDVLSRYDLNVHLQESPAFPLPILAPTKVLHTSQWTDVNEQPILRVGVLRGGEYFGFFYSDGVRFVVDRRGSEVWADWPDNYSLEDACTYLLGPVMGFVLRLRGVVCLHASAVAIGDQAIALVGLAGAGKSTTAAAFGRCGFPVLSDDVVALADRKEYFLVQPGYPRVNLWPDSVRKLFGSEDALPRITPTWGKRYMALGENTFPFASRPLPLTAIYFLSGAEVSKGPVIEKVVSSEAFMSLVANTYLNYLLDRDMRAREFDALSRVLTAVSVRRSRPAADSRAISDLCETIAADVTRLAPAEASLGAARAL